MIRGCLMQFNVRDPFHTKFELSRPCQSFCFVVSIVIFVFAFVQCLKKKNQ